MTMGHVAQCGAMCSMWCGVCDVVRCVQCGAMS